MKVAHGNLKSQLGAWGAYIDKVLSNLVRMLGVDCSAALGAATSRVTDPRYSVPGLVFTQSLKSRPSGGIFMFWGVSPSDMNDSLVINKRNAAIATHQRV